VTWGFAGAGSGRPDYALMVWSLMYSLTRRALGLIVLAVRSDAAEDVEMLVLRHLTGRTII
jgi:putative transposase